MQIQVIGDDVWAEGYLVAMLTTEGCPGVVRDEFAHWLGDADAKNELNRTALDKLETTLKAKAKGGLLRFADVIEAFMDVVDG